MEQTALSSFLTTVTGGLSDFNVTNIGTIVLAALGITVPLALAWFGYRWVTRKAAKGIKKGGI